jgi:hypothetical protein
VLVGFLLPDRRHDHILAFFESHCASLGWIRSYRIELKGGSHSVGEGGYIRMGMKKKMKKKKITKGHEAARKRCCSGSVMLEKSLNYINRTWS